jgi:histidyl-tRNA synthetase
MNLMRLQAPRGTEDVLPSEVHLWLWLEHEFRELTKLYGYSEIRTPTFEEYELFARTSGETSDVVSKEMYEFTDKGGRHIALKPEGTAPVMRALIEHNLCPPGQVVRLSYIINCFRYGRPQKGRLRELHQTGLELVGSAAPEADAEIIEVTARFYERLGFSELEVLVNSIGREECRATYRAVVLEHFKSYLADLDPEQREKSEKNPLRLLDTKDAKAEELKQSVPSILEYLEDEARSNFDRLQVLLSESGIRYRVDPSIVRGLDYYTDTVFEVQSSLLGSQSSLCGGGRYDRLVQQLGGSPTPAVGVGIGIERALIVAKELGLGPAPSAVDVFLVQASEEASGVLKSLARDLRAAGVAVLQDYEGRSMKSQLKSADKSGARWAVIMGEDELAAKSVTLRDLKGSSQEQVSLADLIKRVSS